MSDFFTRLAERTLGQALTIQPFKPSLFAPEPDADADMPSATERRGLSGAQRRAYQSFVPTFDLSAKYRANDSQITSATHIIAPPQPNVGASAELAERLSIPSRPSVIYRLSALAPSPEPSTAVGAGDGWSAGGSVGGLVPVGDEGLTPTKLSVNGTLSRANLHQSSEQNRRHIPTAETFSPQHILPLLTGPIELADQQPNLNAQHTVISQTHPSSYDESSSSQRAESINLLVGAGEASGGDGAHHPPDGVLVPVRHADRNIGMPLVGVRPDGLVPSACPAPPPTIQVTIGRVEVRAVTAPATTTHSQQQPVKPPAMSLDEYLRRQEQGGR